MNQIDIATVILSFVLAGDPGNSKTGNEKSSSKAKTIEALADTDKAIDLAVAELKAGTLTTEFEVDLGGDASFKSDSSAFKAKVFDAKGKVLLEVTENGDLPTQPVGIKLLVVRDRQMKKQVVTIEGKDCRPVPLPEKKGSEIRIQYEVK